jgi:Protein of unknown function (DUF4231)
MPALDRDAYLSGRVDEQLNWLSRASRSNKRVFLSLRILEILLGTSITVFSPYANRVAWAPLAIALAGGGIALSGGWLALSRSQENWVRYRSLSESLKREKFLFLTGSPPYDRGDSSFTQFVTATEALMIEERAGWARQLSQQEEADAVTSRTGPGQR